MGFKEWFGGGPTKEELGINEAEKKPTVHLKGKIENLPKPQNPESDLAEVHMNVFEFYPNNVFSPRAQQPAAEIMTTWSELNAARLGDDKSDAYELNGLEEAEGQDYRFITSGAKQIMAEIKKGEAIINDNSSSEEEKKDLTSSKV